MIRKVSEGGPSALPLLVSRNISAEIAIATYTGYPESRSTTQEDIMQTLSEQFAQAIQNKFDAELELERLRGKEYVSKGHDFTVEPGKKYDRIVMAYRSSTQRSVHAFVEKATGKLIKPAGWAAPAKKSDGELQSRYNLSTPEGFREAVYNAHFAGGYLYADYIIQKVA